MHLYVKWLRFESTRGAPDQGCLPGSYTAGMRPDATSPSPSPLSAIPEAEWLCANELAFAIFDSFPVSPGHVLVITRRVVPTYFDCTAAEQAAVMELVGEVKRLLDERPEPKPDGYNVGFTPGPPPARPCRMCMCT